MRWPRRNHSAKFKAQVALEAIRGEKTIAEIAAHHEVHPKQVTVCKTQVLENLATIFGDKPGCRAGSTSRATSRRLPLLTHCRNFMRIRYNAIQRMRSSCRD
jgi:transposase